MSNAIQKAEGASGDGPSKADQVHEVFQWILAGLTEHQLNGVIAEKWPDEKPKPLIVAAMKQVLAAGDADPAVVRGWCIEATRALYQKALAVNDFDLALKAVSQMARLAGK